MLTTAQTAFKMPGARAALAVKLFPRDPNNDNAVVDPPLCISDTPIWTPDDSADKNLSFKNAIRHGDGMELSEHLTRPGKLSTSEGSSLTPGTITFHLLDSAMVNWMSLDWNGASAEIYVGALVGSAGQRLDLADFDLLLKASIEDVDAVGDLQARVTFKDLRAELEKEISDKVYVGLGGAFPFRTLAAPPVGTYLEQAHDVSMDISGSMAIEWFGHIEGVVAQPSSAFTPILMNGSNAGGVIDVNYALFIEEDAGGKLAFASGSEVKVADYAPTIGAPVYFCASVSGTVITYYAGDLGSREPDALVQIGTASLPGGVSSGPTDGFRMGQDGGSRFVTYEARLWNQALTFDEIRRRWQRTLSEANGLAGLLECWRFGEGAELGAGPERVFGEQGVIDLIPAGDDPVWISSYTGDMPDQFSGSVAGKSLGRTYGPAANAPLARIDSQRHIFAWDDEESGPPDEIRMRGVPMVPEHEVESALAGEITAAAAGNTLTITNPAIGSFARFVPGQETPSRLGQRIEILYDGTPGLNAGIYRVGVAGVSADGLTLTVQDKALQTESCPAATIVRTWEPDEQYSLDLTKSVAVIKSDRVWDISGDATADRLGRILPGGGSKWSELFELITGVAPDTTAVTFDPVLGFDLAPGSAMSTKRVLDEMARSAFGWWVERPDGSGYRLGTFQPPAGPSVADLVGPGDFFIDPLPNSPIPHYRWTTRYGKIWKVQTADSLATSVTQANRQRWSTEYQDAQYTDLSVLEGYPNAVEHQGFNTWIVSTADANTYNDIAAPILTERARWYRLSWGSFWPLFILPGDTISVTWDDPSLRLSSELLRVTGRTIDTGDFAMTLEAFAL